MLVRPIVRRVSERSGELGRVLPHIVYRNPPYLPVLETARATRDLDPHSRELAWNLSPMPVEKAWIHHSNVPVPIIGQSPEDDTAGAPQLPILCLSQGQMR